MPNIQVTTGSSPQNAHSESSIAINPNNPLQIVSASKMFVNIETYNFTMATQYSADGGQTWRESSPLGLPAGYNTMGDPALAWDDSGNVFAVGLCGIFNPTPPPALLQTVAIIAIFKSTDGGKTWGAPFLVTGTSADKQWAAGDSNPASPFHGNVYVVWDNVTAGGMVFVKSEDHGATWTGPGGSPLGTLISTGSTLPEMHVSTDGVIYIVSSAGGDIPMLVSTDGGNTFLPSATAPATGITPLGGSPLPTNPEGFPIFPGGTFRLITDPTICSAGPMVLVAWADFREGVSRIYYSRSNDGGATWVTPSSGQPLLSTSITQAIPNFQHFFPQLAVDPTGVIGCIFYEFGKKKPSNYLIDVILSQSFDNGVSFNYFIVTDQPWDPSLDAPLAEGYPGSTFIGDYFGLDASAAGFLPLWTDTRTKVQELFTAILPEKGCQFIINQSTIGQYEVDYLRDTSGPSGIVKDAFRVIVDGFSASQIGVTGPASGLTVNSPTTGMTIVCTGNSSASGGYGSAPQRFTFFYNLDFGTDKTDPAFAFSSSTEFLTLNVTVVANVSASAQIELVKQPDPYMLHGDPPWLSVDLRVFPLRPGQQKFGPTLGNLTAADPTAPNDFIQQVMLALTKGNGVANGQSFDDPSVLSPDEEGSALYLTPTDETNAPVFNFALARVRYFGPSGSFASNVRVFFRLFSAQQTTSIYDYPPGEQYRRATNLQGQPIPLAGVLEGEYVTIPCFALPRVDSTTVSMNQQTDSKVDGSGNVLGNIQTINANASGSEVDTFFGCWLDINQPFKPGSTTVANNVLPLTADAGNLDGPFTASTNPPKPLGQSIARNLHQCLVAEIAFDPVTIPLGEDTSDWDKLAQRNIAWAPVGSADAVTNFEVRPTAVGLPAGQHPDELMIDWGATPIGSVASIYLPATTSDEILSLAWRMYTFHGLTRVDDHTVKCKTGGVTYLPIPPGQGSNYAGLISITFPPALRRGLSYSVVARQVSNAFGSVRTLKTDGRRPTRRSAAASETLYEWRKVIGAFELTIPVSEKSVLLLPEQRQLSVLRWINEAIPTANRWYPVFQRYLQIIAGRVQTFGGDPGKILPSPLGNGVPGFPGYPGHPRHPGPVEHDHLKFTGKIEAIVYDHFGDFEAFVLETFEGARHRFWSREARVLEIVLRAWKLRIVTTVIARHHDRERPFEIILHGPPPAE